MYFTDFMRVDPLEEIERIQREMNRLFNGTLNIRRREFPALNVWSNEDAAVVTAELPGYDVKDFKASVLGDSLTLVGERKPENYGENVTYQRQERFTGRFERTIRLPFPVEANKIEARYQNGVLTIKLPRAESDKPRKIEIKSSN